MGYHRIKSFVVGILPLQRHLIHPVSFRKELVIRQLMTDIQENEDASRNAHRQTQYIDSCVHTLLQKAADGNFEVVSNHGFVDEKVTFRR